MSSFDAAVGAAPRSALPAETFLHPFMKLAAVQPGERVLDIAPGEGDAAVAAAGRAGDTGEVLAISDGQERADAVAARALAQGVTGLRTTVMDPARLELPDAYWDVAICHFGLDRLADPEQTVKEVLRVLRPVGRLAVSALGARDRCPLITTFVDAVSAHIPAIAAEARALFHYSEPGRLAALLAEQGFQDAVPERLTEWVSFASVDAYWEALTAARIGRAAARLPDDTVAACKAEIERRTRFYRRGGGIELKVEAILLAAVK